MLMDLSGNRYGRGLVRPGRSRLRSSGPTWRRGSPPGSRRRGGTSPPSRRSSSPSRRCAAGSRGRARSSRETGGGSRHGRAGGAGVGLRAGRPRLDFPDGVYRFAHIPLSVVDGGDVAARAQVRRLETERSIAFLLDRVAEPPRGRPQRRRPAPPLAPDSGCIVLTEAWRGECVHVALTDRAGRFARYKVIDPSFRNWSGLAMALAERGDLGLPALQQELQPLLRGPRPLTDSSN